LFGTISHAQGGRNYGKEAEYLWASGLYCEAADAFKNASLKMHVKNEKAKETKANYAFLSGECYKLKHDFASAEQQYEVAILLGYHETDPKIYFYLGEMQMAQGEHKKAEGNYKKYKELNPADPIVAVRIESCKGYKEFVKNKTRHEIEALIKLNTPNFDYSTVLSSRGDKLYFTSSRSAATGDETDQSTCEDYTDIFVTTIDKKGNYSEPLPLPASINTIDNEGAMCLDGRGRTMFFTRCLSEEKMNLGCDIFMAEVKGDKYGKPVKLTLKDDDTTHVGHPAVSNDGKTLIFASNMAGGEGGVDLWMTTYDRKEDSWSLPVNLGPEVNTPGNDVFPVWAEDGTLYYSTDGLVGAGGLDLFKAEKSGDENKWTNPTNLGAPLNTYGDDYHLIFEQNDEMGQKGYLSSNRAGSKGSKQSPSQDLYRFHLPPVLVDLFIEVVDQETGEVIPDAQVRVVGSDGMNYSGTTDVDGQKNLTEKEDGTRHLKPGNTYTIEIIGKDGEYLGNKDNFTTVDLSSATSIVRRITVLNITHPIRLPEVRYALGSAELLVDSTIHSKDSLNYLYDLMMANPNITIELMAHTDARGSASANQSLSQRRAQSCVDYLVNEKGLDTKRLTPKGYGENVPTTLVEVPETGDTITHVLKEAYINQFKSSDKTRFEWLHQKNRRTEGKILTTDYVPAVAPEPENNGSGQ
jgi:outer membrane protein OmpA-like peptidoglycan-associated protein/tetratricopeptide (TPR) repeat protein